MYSLIIAAFFLITPFSTNLYAQESSSTKTTTEEVTEDTPRTFPVIPIAFSTDETGVGFGLLFNQVITGSSEERPSDIQAYAYYTSKDQYNLSVKPSLYFQQGLFHLDGVAYTKYTPSTFWGIGKDAGDQDNEEDFTSTGRGIFLSGTTRIKGPYRAGLSLSYNRKKISDEEPGGLLSGNHLTGENGGHDVGVGLLTEMDNRDSTYWPTTGNYSKISAMIHRYGSGSDFNYNEYNLDLRTYRSISNDSLIAFRFITTGASGTPPFYALRQLGGSQLMRGLYGGRYRDRWLYGGQVEYRLHLTGRFSGTLFTAIGNVAERADQLLSDSPLITGGCGLRFALDPDNRVNLRLDIGISKHGTAPIVTINEAF